MVRLWWHDSSILVLMYEEALRDAGISVAVVSEGVGAGYFGASASHVLVLNNEADLQDPEIAQLIREVLPPEGLLVDI
jgi:hypothetical protein